jgi:peptide/nickel transport system permease protein
VLIVSVVGTVIGAWSAPGGPSAIPLLRRAITLASRLIISAPTFVIANLLILGALKANSTLGVQLFEYTGETSPDAVGGFWNRLVDRAQHLVLPTFTLALTAIAGFSRYQRNAMLDVLGQDFIRTARAKGLTRRQALFKHGLRTALIPMATLFAYSVGGLFTGAVFVEKIFGWHGMGEWVVQGIATQDTNIVVAITVFTGVTILLAGLLSDVIYAALDPRVRVG